MSYKPTNEQLEIVKAAKEGPTVISAASGTGKTSTLCLVAEAVEGKSLMLVFNKAAKLDADSRFPPHVETRTTHSVAYQHIGHEYQHKLTRPSGKYINVVFTGAEIGRYYRLREISYKDKKGELATLSVGAQGVMIKKTVERYEQSADEKITKVHVPKKAKELNIGGKILMNAKSLWRKRVDLDSEVLVSHDTYMKLFQLSKPTLPHKVIYLDEAQDTSLCTLDIVNNQSHAKIIVVGDEFQKIYGWRGSVNAMVLSKGKTKKLTQSFRFGQALSDIANAILDVEHVTSAPWLETKIQRVDEDDHYAILFRTNAGLLVEAVRLIMEGKRVNLEIDVRNLCVQLEAAQFLFEGEMKKIKHADFLMFGNWGEALEEAKADSSLKRLLKLIEDGQAKDLIKILASHTNVHDPDVTLTTAHKSKGREFRQVRLADDFPDVYDGGVFKDLPQEEKNTLYVAATRAMKVLEVNTTVKDILLERRITRESEAA